MLKRVITPFELFSFQYLLSFFVLSSCYLIDKIMAGRVPLLFCFLSHRFSFKIDAMGTMAQTIQDSIRDGPFANKFVPLVDRELGANDG